MAYPDELLDSAMSLFQVSPETQATLRRAVSSAYYALFHLLIGDACKNWSRAEQRGRLARKFEHARMLAASKQCVDKYKSAAPGTTDSNLFTVAHAFFNFRRGAISPTTIFPGPFGRRRSLWTSLWPAMPLTAGERFKTIRFLRITFSRCFSRRNPDRSIFSSKNEPEPRKGGR
jgi:hypothetical protein